MDQASTVIHSFAFVDWLSTDSTRLMAHVIFVMIVIIKPCVLQKEILAQKHYNETAWLGIGHISEAYDPAIFTFEDEF
jgi:hypothetical protein